MFIQVIQGPVSDAAGLSEQLDRWLAELAAGASGWLGSTGGVTDDGVGFLTARFDSEASARANSERPEQGAWWAGTAACFDGEPGFREGSDVEDLFGGGSDDAQFVQIMQFSTGRRAELVAFEREVEPMLRELHVGLLGGLRVWTGEGEATEINYFRDEASARAGEQAMGEHPELAERLGTWQGLMDDVAYFDLRQPRLVSP